MGPWGAAVIVVALGGLLGPFNDARRDRITDHITDQADSARNGPNRLVVSTYYFLFYESGRLDLNQRPLRPEGNRDIMPRSY